MASPEAGTPFGDIVIFNASQDPQLREAIRWIVDESFGTEDGEEPDFYMLLKHMHDDWGLDETGFDRAATLCEEAITNEVNINGQA